MAVPLVCMFGSPIIFPHSNNNNQAVPQPTCHVLLAQNRPALGPCLPVFGLVNMQAAIPRRDR